MKQHKAQPYFGQSGIFSPWDKPSDDMRKGLELAAYICSMYANGAPFAEAILSRGEQIRAAWWIEKEKLDELRT